MQILPNTPEFDTPSIIKADGSEPQLPQNAPFAHVMENIANKARQQAQDVAHDQKLAVQRKAAQRESGEHGIGQGMEVSREDFAAIRDKLKDQGLSEKDIKELEDKVNSEEGLTWKGMLQFVADKLDISLEKLSPEITQAMRNELTALFTKMGFDEKQSENLLRDLENGRQRRVWHILSRQANQLGDDDLQNITRGELKTLAAAMGLPNATLQRLNSMLQGDPGSTMPAKGARMALDAIFNESAKTQKQFEDKLGELRKLIEQGIQDAKSSKDMQSLSDNRETREVASAKVMIKDEAEKNFRSGGKQSQGKEAGAPANADASGKTEASDQDQAEVFKKQDVADRAGKIGASDKAANAAAAKNADSAENAEFAPDAGKNARKTGDAAATAKAEARDKAANQSLADQALGKDADAKGDNESKEKGLQQDSNRKAFDDMWSRVSFQGQAKGDATMQQAERIVNQTFSHNPELGPETSLGDKVPPKAIARTVQNGILQNLQQGGKQLTLRLDPPSLGKLSVILQVHNNEVRATIRTENTEASRLVNDQLNLIRHTLEQQGLKVEKLDVQTQTNSQDQNHRSWQGTQEHNLHQERNRDSLNSALRYLHKRDGNGDELAHEMQSSAAEESISQQGIHLIA